MFPTRFPTDSVRVDVAIIYSEFEEHMGKARCSLWSRARERLGTVAAAYESFEGTDHVPRNDASESESGARACGDNLTPPRFHPAILSIVVVPQRPQQLL